MAASADSSPLAPVADRPGTTPKSIGSAQAAESLPGDNCTGGTHRAPCFLAPTNALSARDVAASFFAPALRRMETAKDADWPVKPFITPLTYGDALDLVDPILSADLNRILLRDRLAHLLMTVDTESRKQAQPSTCSNCFREDCPDCGTEMEVSE